MAIEMSQFNKIDRKTFIKTVGTAIFGSAFGSWRAVAKTHLNPSSISIGHITDTFFADSDDPKKSGRLYPGWLYGHAFALADDLMRRFMENSSGPVDMVVHSGNLLRSGRTDQAAAALDWLNLQKVPIRLTLGESDSSPLGLNTKEFISKFSSFGFNGEKGYYSYNMRGFHFIHLVSPVEKQLEQQDWIRENLAENKNVPSILIIHNPLEKDILNELFGEYDQVLVVLSGGTFSNNAAFEAGLLSLSTCSPVIYPCGARIIKIDISRGKALISSEFFQTRRLELVEKSFHQLHSRKNIKKLGHIKTRRFFTNLHKKTIEPVGYETNPALAPRLGSDSSIVLALLADTHICLDKYVFGEVVTQNKETPSEYEISGHFIEKGSRAIYNDILEQISQGVHRVEFYDEVFNKNPQSETNFLETPVDALLLNGDLTEHSMFDEAEVVLEGLNRLPDNLRQSTFVTPGNHDLYRGDFIEKDSASSRKPFADFFSGYVSPKGSTYYTVQLADWLTLIVLDSVIPTASSLGMLQDQIDWLEYQIEKRKKQFIIVACHHPIYPVSQVPRVMSTYLKIRSHFTPKVTSARTQVQELFARNNNVKLVLSGHYHGTCTDQYRKRNPQGEMYDDFFTTHIQVPCTIEYPNGYRILKISRSKNIVSMNYVTAYTRLANLRTQSSQAKLFSVMGADIKVPRKYKGARNSLDDQSNILRTFDRINPIDMADMNIRGYKDGTTNNGRGNSGKNNIHGKIEFTI